MLKCLSVQILAIVLTAAPMAAQETTAPTPPRGESDLIVTRIFSVEHARVQDLARVVTLFGGRVQPEPELGVIGWTGPESQLPAVEAAIRSLDVAPVPEPNVELTVYFLVATKEGEAVGSLLPAALDGVSVQLQEVFGYHSIRLLETNALQVRNGSSGEINGILAQGPDTDGETRYEFVFRRLQVTEDASGRSIRLDSLRASIATPAKVVVDGEPTIRMMDSGIRTDIDLREGQKAVIGKTTIEGGSEAIFVVVNGEIVE